MKRHLLPYLLTVLLVIPMAATLLTACDNDDDDAPASPTLYDVVQFAGTPQGTPVFNLWRPDAAEPVVLTATEDVDMDKIQPEQFLFMAYVPTSHRAYVSGPVKVTDVAQITNQPLRKAKASEMAGWDADPVYLMSLWRAGDAVIMRMKLTYQQQPQVLALVADEATLTDAYPHLYLDHRNSSDQPNFMRQYYVAFSLKNLWTHPGVKGAVIHVSNSNLPAHDTFTIANPHL